MSDSKAQRFREAYKAHYKEVLEPAQRALKDHLKTWKRPTRWDPYRASADTIPSPVQRTRVRIKRLESVEDKIARNPKTFPNGPKPVHMTTMNDLLGARIIVYFVSDLPLIDRELQACPEIELTAAPRAYLPQDLATQLGMDDLERLDKESGYASIHYQCELRGTPLAEPPRFELQVRTLVEDVWGEIEHILGYKRQKKTALPVTREFQILSKQLGAIDEQFALLYERQLQHRAEIMISEQDPPNAENIPRELAAMGLDVSQNEIDGLLKVMASRGMATIGELRIRGSKPRIHAIRKAWESQMGSTPTTFDVIAVLGTISSTATVDEVRQRTVEWATVAREWSKRPGPDGRMAA